MKKVSKERKLKATKSFLIHEGYSKIEEIEDDFYIDIVAFDNNQNQYVFFNIHDGFKERPNNKSFEEFACLWFQSKAEDCPSNIGFRFDTIGIKIVGDDKALIKHQINASNN